MKGYCDQGDKESQSEIVAKNKQQPAEQDPARRDRRGEGDLQSHISVRAIDEGQAEGHCDRSDKALNNGYVQADIARSKEVRADQRNQAEERSQRSGQPYSPAN